MDRLVSVIVPVYNTAPYLERCVRSVLTQTWKHLELILIDDGSTDGSGAMCDTYACEDPRVRVFHKSNGGVSSARNLGLQNIKGEWFLFLDSDDSLDRDTLRFCVEAAADSTDAVVFGWQELIDGKQVNYGSYSCAELTDMAQMVQQILADRHIYGGGYPNKLWRKGALPSGGVPLFSEDLFYVEDMEWVIRMLLELRHVRVIEPIFYNYHLRGDSASRSEIISEKRLIGYHDTLARMVEDLGRYPELHHWFDGVRWTELINSIIDARMKHQTAVYRTLYQKLSGKTAMLLRSDLLSGNMKLRLIAVTILHWLRLI